MASASPQAGRDSDWAVAGEGNANIVLVYRGDDPQLLGLALRVAKDSKEVVVSSGSDPADQDAVEEAIWGSNLPSERQLMQRIGSGRYAAQHASALRQVAFQQRVLAPLLGKHHVNPVVPIHLPASASAALAASGVSMEEGRPATLLPNNASLRSGVLPDGIQTVGPVLCVELKPKWGFLPQSPFLNATLAGGAAAAGGSTSGSKADAEVAEAARLLEAAVARARLKAEVPRFTMHQLLKRQQRADKAAAKKAAADKVARVVLGSSQEGGAEATGAGGGDAEGAGGDGEVLLDTEGLGLYNPLDLYSEEPERMEKALRQLISVPGNNLRLFVDGKLRVGGRPDADSHSNTYAQQASAQQPEQQPGKGGKDLSSGGSSQAMQAVAEVLQPILDLSEPKEGVAGGPGAGAGQAEPGEREVAHLIALVCGALKCEGVLSRVQAVQSLDPDIEAVLPMYARLVSELEGRGGAPTAVPLSRLQAFKVRIPDPEVAVTGEVAALGGTARSEGTAAAAEAAVAAVADGEGGGVGEEEGAEEGARPAKRPRLLQLPGGATGAATAATAATGATMVAAGADPEEAALIAEGLAVAQLPDSPLAALLSLPRDGLCERLRQFLASATLKDCGVMVTFQRVQLPPQPAATAGGAALQQQQQQPLHAAAAALGFVPSAADPGGAVVGGSRVTVLQLQRPGMTAASGMECAGTADGTLGRVGPGGDAAAGAAAGAEVSGGADVGADGWSGELKDLLPAAAQLQGGSVPHLLLIEPAAGGEGVGGGVEAAGEQLAYLVKVALLDLDPKPASRIPLYYALDRRITACALRHMDLLRGLGFRV